MSDPIREENLIQELARMQKENLPCALVTVIFVKGSTPREAGAMMLVLPDGSIHGTIGGSKVEALLINDALKAMEEHTPRKVEYSISDSEGKGTGMICGGVMEFFIQPFCIAPELLIFGGGHCALALCKLASTCGFSIRIYDERPEFAATGRFPEAVDVRCGKYADLIRGYNWSKKPFVVILTHSHSFDSVILGDVIGRQWSYLGMIGSVRKKSHVFSKLESGGIDRNLLNKVSTPVGLEIGAETPAEIAVSIVAEMIKVRRSSC